MITTSKLRLLFLAILILIGTRSQAQVSLFTTDTTYNPLDRTGWSGRDSLVIAALNAKKGFFLNAWSIQMNPLDSVLDSMQAMTVDLPNWHWQSVKLESKSFEFEDDANWSYYGHDSEPDTNKTSNAYFWLTNTSGNIFGSFMSDSGWYEIQTMSDGQFILLQLDPYGLPSIPGCNQEGGGSQDKAAPPDTVGGDAPTSLICPIRVLVLTTAGARAEDPNIVARANNIISQANGILLNSDVVDTRLELANVVNAPFAESAFRDIASDVLSLVNNPSINSLRTTNLADLTLVLTKSNWYSQASTNAAFGRVAAIGPYFDSSFAIAETQASNSSRFSAPHELSHLLGCRHDIANDPTVSIGHGKIFRSGGTFGFRLRFTMMATFIGARADRIPILSNPMMRWNGSTIGSADENNAKKFRSQACYVGSFENPNEGYSLTLDVPDFHTFCPCSVYPVTSVITGYPTLPITYAWYKSSDGRNYTLVGSSFYYTAQHPCAGDPHLYLKLVTTDAANVVESNFLRDFGTVYSHNCAVRKGKGELPTFRQTDIRVTNNGERNPALNFMNYRDLPAQIFISDVLGRKILYSEIVDPEFKINSLHPGSYIVKVQTQHGYSHLKLLVR